MTSNIVTIPNLLTFVRMILVPIFASLLFYGYFGWALFVFRGASFWLCGVDDLTLAKTDIKAALKGSLEDEMKILLAHNPKILYRAARRGVDLMLSGHTHGGQVKLREDEDKLLPTRRLQSGLYRRKDTQVYITRGIGTVVVPMRYHCPPEITLIELRIAN